MIAFGLILLLAVGLIAGFALAAGDDPAVLNLLGFELDTNDRGLFATGALCMLGLLIALRVLLIGARRARRRRRELKELRSNVTQTAPPPDDDEWPEDRPSGRRRSRSDDDWDEGYFRSLPHD